MFVFLFNTHLGLSNEYSPRRCRDVYSSMRSDSGVVVWMCSRSLRLVSAVTATYHQPVSSRRVSSETAQGAQIQAIRAWMIHRCRTAYLRVQLFITSPLQGRSCCGGGIKRSAFVIGYTLGSSGTGSCACCHTAAPSGWTVNTYMYYARMRATDIALLSLPQRHPSKRDSKNICAGSAR